LVGSKSKVVQKSSKLIDNGRKLFKIHQKLVKIFKKDQKLSTMLQNCFKIDRKSVQKLAEHGQKLVKSLSIVDYNGPFWSETVED
jgi:hypothetical protein